MKPILDIPGSEFSGIGVQTKTTMIDLPEKCRFLRLGFFLGKLGDNPQTGVIRIAAETKESFYVLVGKRKSEGLFFKALRLVDSFDLFCFTEEQAELPALVLDQLYISSVRIVSTL